MLLCEREGAWHGDRPFFPCLVSLFFENGDAKNPNAGGILQGAGKWVAEIIGKYVHAVFRSAAFGQSGSYGLLRNVVLSHRKRDLVINFISRG